jgi:hypothetical protein
MRAWRIKKIREEKETFEREKHMIKEIIIKNENKSRELEQADRKLKYD